MTIKTLTPMLRTWDLQATIKFYTTVLGFTCQSQSSIWASLKRDDIELMVSAPNNHLNEHSPAFTGSLYFRTDAVDDLWNRLKNLSVVCYNIETFDYGMREFAIYDNNGYLLQFGQPITEITDSPGASD
ncbi:MAG TPA: VOC family protein [Steroidobacteraceae bacterium]|nr:VOC family protein [Steroidobacteraceae bacterium]